MLWSLAFLMTSMAATPLADYLARPDASFKFAEVARLEKVIRRVVELEMTSQTWQGFAWKHRITGAYPRSGEALDSDVAILYVTGDYVAGRDLPFIEQFADVARLPVYTLFDVPNQPIFEAREDALIAITFGRYLETGDASWPLLFPMTKSVLRAMDAIQKSTEGKIKRFVVTGASKRGWTTWLVGASQDRRVIGIAPMVIDTLNMAKQLEYQRESWGDYSPEIADYVKTGLVDVMQSEAGKKLIEMVDPYAYLGGIRLPVLVVTGGNDRYWTVDAHRWYWDQIRGPKWMRVVPNAGHNLNGGREAAASVALFARGLAGLIPGGVPKLDSTRFAKSRRTWRVQSDSLKFHDETWKPDAESNANRNEAFFTEVEFEVDGLRASFTSTVSVRRVPR